MAFARRGIRVRISTCLSLSFGSRSTARSLLPRRLVRAQEVSQKGLQHAEEKGDTQTRKGRRGREKDSEERERRAPRRRGRERGGGGGGGGGEEHTAIRRPVRGKNRSGKDADFSRGGQGVLAEHRRRGGGHRASRRDLADSLSRNEEKEAGTQTAVAKDESERRSGCGGIRSLSALPLRLSVVAVRAPAAERR